MYDLLIKNGLLIDGTGAKGRMADIAVTGDTIVKVAERIDGEAKEVIDAGGQIVSPGFIDVHTHDDLVFDLDPANMPKLRQGVTTVITGNCGFGAAPFTAQCRQDLIDYNAPIVGSQVSGLMFETFGAYLEHMDQIEKAMNVACLVPHGAVYMAVNGFSDRAPDEERREQEAAYVAEAMDAGALGLSFGLMYAPGCWSDQVEQETLARVVGEKGGIVTVHMKSESDHFRDSLEAAVRLSGDCHVPVEISHLKNVGKEYWGAMAGTLAWLEKLLADGADLSFDMYPYTMGSTTMAILFPTEYLKDGVKPLLGRLTDPAVRSDIAGRLKESWGEEDNLSLLCGWDNVILSSVKTEKNTGLLGKSVGELAAEKNADPADVFMDLFLEEDGEVSVLLNHIAQDDMEQTLMFERVSIASDGLPGAKAPHPRLYGTFPKFLREFVREKKLLTWEAAIHKITQQPAERFRLGRRGVVREGYCADLVVFDPDRIRDLADFQYPKQYAEGIKAVIVNGIPAWKEGGSWQAGQGRLIRRTI